MRPNNMLTKRQLYFEVGKNVAIMLVAIICAAMGSAFFANRITQIADSLIEKERLSFVLSRRGEYLAELDRTFARLGDGDRNLVDAFPPTDDILGFVAALDSVARRTGVTQTYSFGVPSVFGDPATDKIPLAIIEYNLSVNGNVQTFLNYLKEFERLPYFSGIRGITITGDGTGGWESGLQANLSAVLYARQLE